MPTEAKRQAVTELAELIRSSSAMAVADYRGLKVSEMQAVRRTLRESGVQLTIAKNRLLKIAADEAERPELKPMLDRADRAGDDHRRRGGHGQGARRCLPPVLAGGQRRGAGCWATPPIDASQLTRLATLPSREVLLGKLAGGMAAPLSGMAGVLAGNLRTSSDVLSAVADKKRANRERGLTAA